MPVVSIIYLKMLRHESELLHCLIAPVDMSVKVTCLLGILGFLLLSDTVTRATLIQENI